MTGLLKKMLVSAVLLSGQLVVSETLIYLDSFDGDAETKLNRQAPNTAPEGVRWDSIKAGTPWMADGSIGTQDQNQNRNAFLPFVPEAGKVYALSLDMNPGGPVPNNFFCLGFSSDDDSSEGYISNRQMAVSPWIFVAGNGTVRTYTGPGNAGNEEVPVPEGGWGEWVSVKMVLDTTSEPWSVEWFVDGTSVRTHKFYTGNPEINYVTFGRFRRASGAVDNFKLAVVSK